MPAASKRKKTEQMSLKFVRNILAFVILLLVQSLVLNHIHLFDCATPLLYVSFVLPTPRDQQRWATLVWCFALGLAVDMFSNTPGVAAASMTLVGLLQPYLLALFLPRDCPDDLVPSFATLGTAKYVAYASVIIVVYCLLFFTIEAFNFYHWLQWLQCVCGCAVLTVLLTLVIENLRKR